MIQRNISARVASRASNGSNDAAVAAVPSLGLARPAPLHASRRRLDERSREPTPHVAFVFIPDMRRTLADRTIHPST